MRKEMVRHFDELEGKHWFSRFKVKPFCPPADIGEAHGEVYVNIQVPGVSKEDLKLQLLEGRLIIRGDIKEKVKEDKSKHRKKIRRRHFSREIPLPEKLDVEKAKACLDQEILRVHIPKLEKSEKSAVTVPIE
jgi:HSP20 family protein